MSDKPSTTERIIAELRERHEKGLAKYGVTVDRTDLTPAQWGQHMKEELMDATLYVQRLIDTMKEQESRIAALEAYVDQLEKVGDPMAGNDTYQAFKWNQARESKP